MVLSFSHVFVPASYRNIQEFDPSFCSVIQVSNSFSTSHCLGVQFFSDPYEAVKDIPDGSKLCVGGMLFSNPRKLWKVCSVIISSKELCLCKNFNEKASGKDRFRKLKKNPTKPSASMVIRKGVNVIVVLFGQAIVTT